MGGLLGGKGMLPPPLKLLGGGPAPPLLPPSPPPAAPLPTSMEYTSFHLFGVFRAYLILFSTISQIVSYDRLAKEGLNVQNVCHVAVVSYCSGRAVTNVVRTCIPTPWLLFEQ